jgi:hypothetical protein
LKELSIFLRKDIYIKSVFRDYLKMENHPLVQFHLLYQIVELLIENVFRCEEKRILTFGKDVDKTPHDLIKELQKYGDEDHRIKKLFERYLRKNGNFSYTASLQTFNDLLIKFNREKSVVAEALYQVRNIIVHDLRGVAEIDHDYSILKEINSEFEKLTVEILSSYIEPEEEPIEWLKYKFIYGIP